ncbi:unnamed protein product [Hymenolepis diminuta]|uniref:Uncharacterized protein n=1 Tax=Hymenolepis diminuta TaxID=6216 RepID=A0A564YUM0_HYMDI|nr:unnamed protein product [Hymenolepis diminuta]
MRKKNKGSQSKSKYDKISIRNSENTENPCVAKQEENSGSKIISSPILSTTCSSTLVPSDILRPDSENASHDTVNCNIPRDKADLKPAMSYFSN